MLKKFLLAAGAVWLAAAVNVQGNDTIAGRRQFRAAVKKNPAAAAGYLQDKDPEIRRYALYLHIKSDPVKHLPLLAQAMQDPDDQVRLTAVKALRPLAKKNAKAQKLLVDYAVKDRNEQIRQIGVTASWPFHREIKLLRNDPSWDLDIQTVKVIPLTNLPWKMQKDPRLIGHHRNWFAVDHNTSKWLPAKMGYFETQGFPDFNGIVWYRIEFDMPAKIASNAVEVSFDAVDESAWVWMNGIYLGCHDLGDAGWNTPFDMDCTKEIRWGRKNVLIVRVGDTANAGGIWKPVNIKVLK